MIRNENGFYFIEKDVYAELHKKFKEASALAPAPTYPNKRSAGSISTFKKNRESLIGGILTPKKLITPMLKRHGSGKKLSEGRKSHIPDFSIDSFKIPAPLGQETPSVITYGQKTPIIPKRSG